METEVEHGGLSTLRSRCASGKKIEERVNETLHHRAGFRLGDCGAESGARADRHFAAGSGEHSSACRQ
jgi:hypothetical protein